MVLGSRSSEVVVVINVMLDVVASVVGLELRLVKLIVEVTTELEVGTSMKSGSNESGTKPSWEPPGKTTATRPSRYAEKVESP